MFKCPLCLDGNITAAAASGDSASSEHLNASNEVHFESRDLLEAHLAAEHFDCLPYTCERCRFSKFPTEFSLRHHYESDHGLKRYHIRFEVSSDIDAKKRKICAALEESAAMAGRKISHPATRNQPQQPLPPLLERMPVTSATSKPRENAIRPSTARLEEGTKFEPECEWPITASTNEMLLKQIEQASSSTSSSSVGVSQPATSMMHTGKVDLPNAFLRQLNAPSESTQTPGAVWNLSPIIGPSSTSAHGGDAGNNGHVTTHKPPSVGYLRCNKCNELVTNRQTSLNYHVNTRHFKYPLFECLYPGCGKQFHWLRNDALNHVIRKHGGDESLVRDNNHLYHGEVNAHRKEFFDSTARIMPEMLISKGLPLPSRKSNGPKELFQDTAPEAASIDATPIRDISLNSFIGELLGGMRG